MKDVIRLVGMPFYGYHGVTPAEKETGRLFEIDCELEVDLAEPGATDRLSDTIDYHQVYTAMKDTVEGTAFSLLEGLASRLAGIILDKFPVYRITLRVRKMHPPIAGNVKYIEVEVTRHQADLARLTTPDSESS